MSKHPIDPTTGMPALPHGWRWKVKRWEYLGGHRADVILQHRRFGIWREQQSMLTDRPVTPAGIIEAADWCLDRRAEASGVLTDDEIRLLGTYPPKRPGKDIQS